MSNWYGAARSNYFRVKDVEAFKEAFKNLEVEIIEVDSPSLNDGREQGMVGLLGDDEYGGFPSVHYDENDEAVDIDVADLVSQHLVDGEVAVFMESGAEKLRYVTGHAWAINNKGETRRVSIDDIFNLARELGPHVTGATY